MTTCPCVRGCRHDNSFPWTTVFHLRRFRAMRKLRAKVEILKESIRIHSPSSNFVQCGVRMAAFTAAHFRAVAVRKHGPHGERLVNRRSVQRVALYSCIPWYSRGCKNGHVWHCSVPRIATDFISQRPQHCWLEKLFMHGHSILLASPLPSFAY